MIETGRINMLCVLQESVLRDGKLLREMQNMTETNLQLRNKVRVCVCVSLPPQVHYASVESVRRLGENHSCHLIP